MNYANKTILIVDDDADDFALLQQALHNIEDHHHIIRALDGVHALELLQQMKASGQFPSLIVLDINMPRLDGKQTLTIIQRDALLRSIPVVLFSTSSSAMDKTFSLLKHVELIIKPSSVKTMHAVATKMLHYCNGHLMADVLSLECGLPVKEI